MPNDQRNPNDKARIPNLAAQFNGAWSFFGHSSLVLGHSLVIRHWDTFVSEAAT
jgi:hypothetical protein